MREILFRGKAVGTGGWAFGNLVIQETDNSEVNFITNNKTVVDVFIQPIKKVWDTHWNSFGRQEWKAVSQMLKVAPYTVGQFTGLTDKNGKKIFEGDIILAVLPATRVLSEYVWPLHVVTFVDGAFGLEHNKKFVPLKSFAPSVTFEVIGNIIDNPELMEDK